MSGINYKIKNNFWEDVIGLETDIICNPQYIYGNKIEYSHFKHNFIDLIVNQIDSRIREQLKTELDYLR